MLKKKLKDTFAQVKMSGARKLIKIAHGNYLIMKLFYITCSYFNI